MSASLQRSDGKAWLSAGWILVSGLLALCVLGTWFTARNYRERVFSSADGTVLENQWPESRIAVEFPNAEASRICEGQVAKITVGAQKKPLRGAVVAVKPTKKTENAKNANTSTVVIKLVEQPGEPAAPSTSGRPADPSGTKKTSRYLPAGTACAVSIDTTVPLFSDDSASPVATPR